MSKVLIMSCALNNKIWLFFLNFLWYYLDKILYQALPKASKEFSKILMLRFVEYIFPKKYAWCMDHVEMQLIYVDHNWLCR